MLQQFFTNSAISKFEGGRPELKKYKRISAQPGTYRRKLIHIGGLEDIVNTLLLFLQFLKNTYEDYKRHWNFFK